MSYEADAAAVGHRADADLAAALGQNASLVTQVGTLTSQLAAANAEVARLNALLNPPVPPPPPPPPPAPGFTKAFAGDVAPGHIRWGLTLPIADTSVPLGAHRAYFGGGRAEYDKLLAAVDKDLAKGTLPFHTAKPGSWAAAARGDYDADLTYLATELAKRGKDVMLSLHHEPVQGNGTADDPSGAAGHLGMNRRFRGILDAKGIHNVSLVSVHMAIAYGQLDMEPWWSDAVYHAVGVDIYNQKVGIGGNPFWAKTVAFAVKHNRKIVIGEWGVLEADASNPMTGAQRITDSYDLFVKDHVAVACYFNSVANSIAPWTLNGTRLTAWTAKAKAATSVPVSAT
jgi:hypothetical protein